MSRLASLEGALRAELAAAVERLGLNRAASSLDVSAATLARAVAGMPVRRPTATHLAHRLREPRSSTIARAVPATAEPGPARIPVSGVRSSHDDVRRPNGPGALCASPALEWRPLAALRRRRERWALVVVARRRRAPRRLAGARPRRGVLGPAWRTPAAPWRCSRAGACRMGLPGSPGCAVLVAARGPLALEAIGELLGVSRERVRQIEVMALARPEIRAWARDVGGEGFAAV